MNLISKNSQAVLENILENLKNAKKYHKFQINLPQKSPKIHIKSHKF